jgi:hypothetical protein
MITRIPEHSLDFRLDDREESILHIITDFAAIATKRQLKNLLKHLRSVTPATESTFRDRLSGEVFKAVNSLGSGARMVALQLIGAPRDMNNPDWRYADYLVRYFKRARQAALRQQSLLKRKRKVVSR